MLRALAAHRPQRIIAEGLMKQAAVAAVLRQTHQTELLLIRRAEHPQDPWSGHMAFPGGRVDPQDPSPLSAAVREAKEEIGLDLDRYGRFAGELSHVGAMAHGKPLPLVVIPYAFSLEQTPELVLDKKEVEEVLWVPLPFLMDPAQRSTMDYQKAGVNWKLPCYRYEGRIIWGLTLRMLDELLGLLAR